MENKRGIRNKTEAQILADFLWKEGVRHGQNIFDIIEDLHKIEHKWKVKPRKIREWVET